MASYQIEVPSPSSPFGSEIRNHSLRDRWINRDKSNASDFKSFKDFVESFSGQKDSKCLSRANSASNDLLQIDVSQNDVQNEITNNNADKTNQDLFVHAPTSENDEKKLDVSQNDVQNKNTKNQTSCVHAPTLTKNDEKKLDTSQNDVQNKNTKNNGNQTSHADLFVHALKHKKNDEIFLDMSKNDVRNKNTNNDNGSQTSNADLFVHAPKHKKNDEKKLANETGLVSSNDCIQQKHHNGGFAPTKPIKTEVNAAHMGGVSSLVRRWRDFEAEAKNSGNNSPMSSKTNSVESSNSNISNNVLDNVDNESLVDGLGESEKMVWRGRESDVVENEKMRVKNFGNQESEKKVSRGRESEVVENEKMRVKKLGDQESEKMVLRGRESEAVENEKKVKKLINKLISVAVVASGGANDENVNGHEANSPSSMGSPCLREHQTFEDFFMVMEKDRHKELDGLEERQVVSRFSKKGRIQAMLRVQLLRVAVEAAREARKSTSTSLEINRTPTPSIKRLSERFNPVSQKPVPELKSFKKEVADSPKVEKSTSLQEIKCTHQQEVVAPITLKKEEENAQNKESLVKSIVVEEKKVEEKKVEEKNILPVARSGNVHEEACSRSDLLQQRTNQENKTCSLSQSVETRVPPTEVKEVRPTDVDNNTLHSSGISVDMQENQQAKETIDHRRNDSINTQEEWEEVMSNQYLTESENGWVSDVSHTQAGWEELQSDYEQQSEGMQEWIWDVSRPKSEWEGLRKERYQEMLDPYKQKEDICRLLESKSVSSFLSSGLRDSIDRLMISRFQYQSGETTSQADEQEVKVKAAEKKFKYRVERKPVVEKDAIEEAEGIDVGYDEHDEDEIQTEQPYEEPVEYADQTPSSLPFSSWNTNQVPETNNVSTQVAFSPLQHNSSLNSYSPEMQLFYELKGHMEKLHQEVAEIRKSVQSCMNMQRHNAKQNVVAALSHSGQNRGRHSTEKKGLIQRSMCSICNDDQVDSLMYRCGHMCTCFKCAHELLRGSGRCPVCEAPIIDVVRVKFNS